MDWGIHIAGSDKRRFVIRLIALTLCVLLVVGSLLFAAFVSTRILHEHDHDDPQGNCAVCAHLAATKDLMKLLSAALASAAFLTGCFASIRAVLKSADLRADFFTLVRRKVRLNT